MSCRDDEKMLYVEIQVWSVGDNMRNDISCDTIYKLANDAVRVSGVLNMPFQILSWSASKPEQNTRVLGID